MSGIALPGNSWDLLDGVPGDPATRVSVIVAHYEQPDQLARTLAALAAQRVPSGELEVIVVDDGSAKAPRVPPGVRLVVQPDQGFRLAAARNLGVRSATGDVLVFLDADTTPEPGFVCELTRLPSLAPDAVTVGRRRHADLSGVAPTADIRGAVGGRELDEPEWLAREYRASRDLLDADDRSYRHLIGAVLACSRRLFDAVGGFDESFTSYGGEDWEWAYRAWLGGAVFAHVPGAVAWHDGPDAAGRPDGDQARRNAETLRLVDLIPVPGSRPRGIRPAFVDVAVTPPPGSTPGQSFVSVDSVVAAVPGAEPVDAAELAARAGRCDRVRLHLEILRPVRVEGEGLRLAVDAAVAGRIGVRTVTDAGGVPAIRVTAQRARARAESWGRDDLFPSDVVAVPGVQLLAGEPRVEAWCGGWG
ncbi:MULTISPECIES: glycosyltransferase family 2 protein [unclassified Microbacterium]|uniref:glycosyltransferase family 2 protein n=1 Tax=unclassified Microbacterium TaxID=2609290 RepID=UPI0038693BE8